MVLPFVTIVIPVFNEEDYIGMCLGSLIESNYPRQKIEILVVDNGSTDRTKEIVSEFDVSLLEKPFVKVGAVRNYGVTRSRGEVIAFLDSDCIVDKDWLKKGVSAVIRCGNCAIGGQYLIRDDASWLERYWILNGGKDKVHQTTLVGGNIFIKRDHFDDIGGFDESLSAGEDSELTERIKYQGYRVEIDPELSVVHLGYPSSIKGFLKRQIWHSSDYVERLPASIKDKVFLLTLAFIFGLFSFFIFLGSGHAFFGWFSVIVIIVPMVLSAKRILRSGRRSYGLRDLVAIYFVDFLYVLGRTFGVISGLFGKLNK